MFRSNAIVELQKSYESGERNFHKIELRRADLRGLNLSHADLSGADLSYAILRDVDFRGANLSEAYLNEADLTGANLQDADLQGAYLIKAYLIKTNLRNSNLSKAYLTGAYLTKSEFGNANLSGAYLNGSKVTGAILAGAYYDRSTHFDIAFDVLKNGLKKISPQQQNELPSTQKQLTVEELIDTLNHLSQLSIHYLGHAMTTRYWEKARPDDRWLTQFQFNRSSKIIFSGDQTQVLSDIQIQWGQEWIGRFIQSCSKIIQDFPRLIELQQVTFPIAALEIYSEKKMLPVNHSLSKISNIISNIDRASKHSEVLTLK